MPRVTFVKSARASKNKRTCFTCGTEIKEGDSYRWFASRIGRSSFRRNYCITHHPRQSHMTSSGHLAQLYGAQENVEDTLAGEGWTRDDIAQALRDASETAQEVADGYTESADNIEDGFGHETQMSEEIREKVGYCEDWASTLDSAADDVEQLEDPDDIEAIKDTVTDQLGEDAEEDEINDAIEEERQRLRDEIAELANTAIYELGM